MEDILTGRDRFKRLIMKHVLENLDYTVDQAVEQAKLQSVSQGDVVTLHFEIDVSPIIILPLCEQEN